MDKQRRSKYEDTMAAVVARRYPGIKPESVAVGLVQVGAGSVAITFDAALPAYVYPAALEITRAIAAASWADLPLRPVKPLRKLVQFLRQKDLAVHFHTVYGAETAAAVVTKTTDIPPTVALYGQSKIILEQDTHEIQSHWHPHHRPLCRRDRPAPPQNDRQRS